MTALIVTSPSTGEDWEIVIGLEVHAELATATKMFCGAPNQFGGEPNTNIDPVTLGLPGSLPVLNETAVELGIRVGLALHCEVRRSIFARKNYFYPDMPKDYQISQFDEPINVDGWLELPDGTRDRHRAGPPRGGHRQVDPPGRRRAHPRRRVLARRLQPGRRARCIEIVGRARPALGRGRPGLRERAAGHPRRHRRVRRQDGGGLDAGRRQRVGAPRRGRAELGTRCEIKNVNSLRSLVRAIEYEAAPPGRPARRRRAGAPGDPPLGRGGRAARAPAGPRRRPRTTATSSSPTWCVVDPSAGWIEEIARRRCRCCRPSAGPAWPRPPASSRPTPRVAIAVTRGLDDLAARRHRGRRRPGPRAHPRRAQPGRRRRRVRSTPAHFAELVAPRESTASSPPPRPRRCWPRWSRPGATPTPR